MKVRHCVIALLSCLLSAPAWAQQPTGQPFAGQFTSTSWFLQNPPVQVTGGSVGLHGNPGPGTYYFWVVANFLIGGSGPSGPFVLTNGPTSFSSSNYAIVSWQPAAGALSYDVLLTNTATPPTGACGCAVVTGISVATANVTSNSTSAYTVIATDNNAYTIIGTELQLNANLAALYFTVQGPVGPAGPEEYSQPNPAPLSRLDTQGDYWAQTLTPHATVIAKLASLHTSGGPGSIATVSDGAGTTDCSVGGGSTQVTCILQADGVTWKAEGSSGGSGTVLTGSTGQVAEYPAPGTTVGPSTNLYESGSPTLNQLNYLGTLGMFSPSYSTNGSGPGFAQLTPGTVATLPNPAAQGTLVNITDGNPGCATGGGSTLATCRCDSASCTGSGWTTLANTGSGTSFGAITSGGNSAAAMVVNSGASLKIDYNAAALPAAQTGTVFQVGNADSTAARLEVDAFGAAGYFSGIRWDGTNASPTTLQAGDEMGGYNVGGYNGATVSFPRGAFRVFANQNWTGGAQGTYADIATTPNGATAQAEVCRFENDAGVTCPSSVTGGDKGAGTLNAAGLFINGAPLSAIAKYGYTFPAIATAQTWAELVPDNAVFPANFASPTSAAKCGTNPTGGTVTFTLTDVTSSATIGTVQITTAGAATFATTGGTTQSVTANDFLTFVSGTDAGAVNCAFMLRATKD